MNKYWFLLAPVLFLFGGCCRNCGEFSPELDYAVQDKYLQQLPAPFPPLTESERQQDWGKEYAIGVGFSQQLDLYQAMTAFKRAEILTPKTDTERLLEMRYEILLCYYFGHKYCDVIFEFEHGALRNITPSFPAFHDLLIVLYDSYQKLGDEDKAEHILTLLRAHYPATAEKLELTRAFSQGDFAQLDYFSQTPPNNVAVKSFLDTYYTERKDPRTAQLLNAFIPGAGYFYLGQPQSGATALLLNGLFIWAAYHFFHHGQIAAGTIFTSFELGWYVGGIIGAGLEAKYYNERLYERLANPVMNNQRLFPVLMLRYGF